MARPVPAPEYLTVRAVAAKLAVTAPTVRSMIRAGKLPAIRPTARTTRVPVSAVAKLAGVGQ